MTGVLILAGTAAFAAFVFVMLAYNHRAELHRRRLTRHMDAILRPPRAWRRHRD